MSWRSTGRARFSASQWSYVSDDNHHSVDDLFYIIRTLMPYGQPATLSKQEYIDIIAYILMVNGYPAGKQPLPPDPRILKRITITVRQP